MNRFEAIDKALEINALVQQNKFGEAMLAIGMTDEQFPEGESVEELLQAFQVRFADLIRKAGIE